LLPHLHPGRLRDWLSGYILLNLIDAFLTMYVLSHGGEETNPVCRWALLHSGTFGFLALKGGQCVLVLWIIQLIYDRRRAAARAVAVTGCGLYLGLMAWDCWLLLQIRA
jgi:hypothetical protein